MDEMIEIILDKDGVAILEEYMEKGSYIILGYFCNKPMNELYSIGIMSGTLNKNSELITKYIKEL